VHRPPAHTDDPPSVVAARQLAEEARRARPSPRRRPAAGRARAATADRIPPGSRPDGPAGLVTRSPDG
jgi:hypothetical protein